MDAGEATKTELTMNRLTKQAELALEKLPNASSFPEQNELVDTYHIALLNLAGAISDLASEYTSDIL